MKQKTVNDSSAALDEEKNKGKHMNVDNTWGTREKDLSIAKSVLSAHSLNNAEDMTLLKDYCIDEEQEQVSFSFPEWIKDLADALYYEHGEALFPFVLSRVLEKIMDDCVIDNKVHPEDAKLFLNIVNTYFHNMDNVTQH